LGQKTHPIGFRLGVIKSWNSKWFAGKNFANFIFEDLRIKRYINARLDNAGLAKVEILRAPKRVTVDIHTSRPGIVIGRKGAEVDKLREELQLLTSKDISLNIIEVKKPELCARIVADSIAHQLEGRISYRRAMKKAIGATMKMGADGIKVLCSGRLGGAEIARSEKYMEGRVPLHTLRADIDYATSTAHTTYGTIGVKVWICRGMIMGAGELVTRDEIDKSLTERPELDMPSKRDRKGRDDKSRRRRPRGRVRKAGARRSEPRSERDSDRRDGPPRRHPDSNRPPRRDSRPSGGSPDRKRTDAAPKADAGKKPAQGGKKPDSGEKKTSTSDNKDKTE
jgi:small subunit ribosomal protein S3